MTGIWGWYNACKPDWITDDIPGDFARLSRAEKYAAVRWLQGAGYDLPKVAKTVGTPVEAVQKILDEGAPT